MKIEERSFVIHGIDLVLSTTPWQEAPAEALVLSANNRLILKNATGLAGWLNRRCPGLHQECQMLRIKEEIVPGRGILPGYGVITDGPDQRKIIHAVSVDYDHSGFGWKPYAGIDTVSAATAFALNISIECEFTSIAFTPMCTRGHADCSMPRNLANILLPQIMAQVIMSKVLTVSYPLKLNAIWFCAPDSINNNNQSRSHFEVIENVWSQVPGGNG